jgi:hypothetical protein
MILTSEKEIEEYLEKSDAEEQTICDHMVAS